MMVRSVRQGAEVYKPQPNYRLTMQCRDNPVKQLVAVSRHRDQLDRIEHDLTRCGYQFVRLETTDETALR